MISLKLAKIAVGIDCKYQYTCFKSKDYLTDAAPLFTVSVTEAEMEEERRRAGADYHDALCEFVVAYRKIAEKLPEYDAFLFHGSVIEVGDYAYVITANSGVGKTTHTRLWLSEFPDASVLNGDKPIIRFFDGKPYACGTPWQGKEDYGKPGMKELRGIIFLSRGEINAAKSINPKDAVIDFMKQIYLPKENKMLLAKTITLADRLMSSVKLVRLECNMDKEAAYVARRAVIGDV